MLGARLQKKLPLLLLAAGLAVAAGLLGYAAWGTHQKRAHRQAVTAVIADTTGRLREALAATLEPEVIEAHAAAADGHLGALGGMPSLNRELSAGAELYVVGAREIFKRQAAALRLSEQTARSRSSLQLHMGRAARRDRGWIDEAAKRKKQLESEYFDYNLALTGLSQLLYTFPEARKQLAPLVHESLLLETGPAEAAWRRAEQDIKRAAADLQAVRRLP